VHHNTPEYRSLVSARKISEETRAKLSAASVTHGYSDKAEYKAWISAKAGGGSTVGVITLSIHQRKIIGQVAADLSEQQRGEFLTGVAMRLSKFMKYSAANVSHRAAVAD
jgi:hypothetical protein